MFRIFTVDQNNIEKEVFPENGVYIVYELFEYKFQYKGNIRSNYVFIEDETLDLEDEHLEFTENSISTKGKLRLFEDYFGYLKLNINNIEHLFEVRIQKLKVPEIEEILLYLWNQDPIIFDNFLSKSALKSKLDIESFNFNYSSKFVNIFEDYYKFFKNSYFTFKSLPHNVLRGKNIIKDYETADISNNSIEWLISNLDELNIDYAFKNIENSIKINNSYGLLEKILTEEKTCDFNVYENQIILGTFDFVLYEIQKIKNKIKNHISTKKYYDKDFFSINEFKTIPFLKIKEDLEKIESKIKTLHEKYKNLFIKVIPRNIHPKLTPVFSNKRHYTEAYIKIKYIRDIKISLEGELILLNIKKLSVLYERFNLFVIINSILEKKPISHDFINPKSEDKVFQEFYFKFPNFELSLYYDYAVNSFKNKTGLQRITNNKKPYRPDYIIKLNLGDEKKYYILDSKYSSRNRIKSSHLPSCINKYILDIGITDFPIKKIEELILIYPGNFEEIIYGNYIFKPMISILPSKVKINNLNAFIERIVPMDN